MDIFSFAFMRAAFLVAILISLTTPLIGNIIVLRRMSNVGDALSHAGLAGVALGLIFGVNPVFASVIFSVISALLIELIRRSFPKFAELSTSIVLSFGIGLAAILSGFVTDSKSFDSFLFGSIILVSTAEIIGIAVLAGLVIVFFIALYKELFYIAFDDDAAKLSGVPVWQVNLIFTILTAITVSIASRTVGALMVSSLMILPVACALLTSKSYLNNILISVLLALVFTISGLFISFYQDVKPSGAIILIALFTLVLVIFGKSILNKLSKKKVK